MSALVFLIEQIAPALYIFLGLGIFLYIRKWLSARGAYRATYFELERDLARYQSGNAVTVLVMFAQLLLVVVGIQQVVAPQVREDREISGSVVDSGEEEDSGVFVTPTRPPISGEALTDVVDAARGIELNQQQAQAVFVTPTLTPTPVGTILPNAPNPVGCTNDRATLQIPANGMRVFQPIRVVGSAYSDNFSQYKIEIGTPGGQFAPIDTVAVPVNELGTLSQFNPGDYAEGEYFFRLTVFDTDNMLVEACRVTIYISDPIPTATPIGAGS